MSSASQGLLRQADVGLGECEFQDAIYAACAKTSWNIKGSLTSSRGARTPQEGESCAAVVHICEPISR